MDTLSGFVNSKQTFNDVRDYLLNTLDKKALTSLKEKGEAVGYREAVAALRDAFLMMEREYQLTNKVTRKEQAL